MLQNLISFAILAWFLTMLPGIDTAQVLRAVAIGGKKQAYATLFGIMYGVWIWGVGAALGISALLVASKTAYLVLKIVGAAYLVYLGARMIWESRSITHETIAAKIEDKSNFRKTFNKAFLITFTNPKNGAFYVAGQSGPGALVRLYLNDSYVGQGNSTTSGDYSFSVTRGLMPGQYRVRIDEVDSSDNKVLSRAEVVFDYAPPQAQAATSAASRKWRSASSLVYAFSPLYTLLPST